MLGAGAGALPGLRSTIPRRHPLIETGAGLVGVWAALHSPDLAMAVMTAILGWQLLLIAVVDAEHFQLPDQLTLPLFVTGLLAAVLLHPAGLPAALPSAFATPLIGAAVGFGGLWLLAWVYRRVRGREGMGRGDPF
jgi:leader peptidase (prepilin peptidase)/N-methyltransferase